MINIIVNIFGLLLIAFIAWWFWIANKGTVAKSDGNLVTIIVDKGVYKPNVIHCKIDKAITLRFIRKDPSPCAAAVIFNDFEISAELPMNTAYDITLKPGKIGTFEFTCEMAMYKGKLVVTAGCCD